MTLLGGRGDEKAVGFQFQETRFAFRSPDKRVARIRGMVAGKKRPRVRFAYPGYGF